MAVYAFSLFFSLFMYMMIENKICKNSLSVALNEELIIIII